MSARRPKPALPAAQLTIVWQSVSLLLDYPDEELLARVDLLRSAAAGAAARDRGLAPRLPRPPGGDPAAGAPGRLRRDLRHPAALQPLPDLLRPRRHPQAGDGAAALQADLPRRRLRARRRRAARPPLRRPRVRRHRRPGAGSRPDARPPGRARAAAPLAARHGLAVGTPGRRGHRHAAAPARRRAGRRTPSRRRGPARGGGRARALRRPAVQPRRAAAGRTTLLPMPSFPGVRA